MQCSREYIFFSIRVFFLGHWWFTGQPGKRRDQLYSTLPLSPDHEYSDIYLQLCIWDDYHVFLIASHVITRLLLDEIYHHWELTIDLLLIKYWLILMIFSARSCYSGQVSDEFEFALTIIIVLKAILLIQYASQPWTRQYLVIYSLGVQLRVNFTIQEECILVTFLNSFQITIFFIFLRFSKAVTMNFQKLQGNIGINKGDYRPCKKNMFDKLLNFLKYV